jgi:hypothetical protein
VTVRLDGSEQAELRRQLVDAFEGADYPVGSPMDLVPSPALPDGPETEFTAGAFSITAVELSNDDTVVETMQFPYGDVESLVDDYLEGLQRSGRIRRVDDGGGADSQESPFDTDDDVYDTEPATTGTGTEVYGEADSGGEATPDGEDINFCTDCGADLTDRTVTAYCPVCGFELG